MDANKKLCLGTVQFGLKYGISNSGGQIQSKDISLILKECLKHNLKVLDTSSGYGQSEELLGRFKDISRFSVISKYLETHSNQILPVKSVQKSLQKLKLNRLYGYLLHHFKAYQKYPEIWNSFQEAKASGQIEKIGFSLYHPSELDLLFENKVCFDIVQIPYNLFDRRFEPYFQKLKDRNIEVYVRSVFLQGLFFQKPENVHRFFSPAIDKIERIQRLSEEYQITVSEVALNFVYSNPLIDRVLIGVDNLTQLKENFRIIQQPFEIDERDLQGLEVKDENILLPYLWRI